MGCAISTSLTITVLQVDEPEPPIIIEPPLVTDRTFVLFPSAFSPNNDGVNDYFQAVQSIDIQPDSFDGI